MGLIVSIVIGGIVGWLASIVAKTSAQMGIVANVIVGVLGSALGHRHAGLLGIAASGTLPSLALSVGGAVLLIAALKTIGIFKR